MARSDQFIARELGEAGLETFPIKRAVSFLFTRQRAGFLWVGGAHALAVNIGCEGDIAEFGELFGAAFGVAPDSHPVVDEENARARLGIGVVVGEKSLQGGVAGLVFDDFGFDFRMGG